MKKQTEGYILNFYIDSFTILYLYQSMNSAILRFSITKDKLFPPKLNTQVIVNSILKGSLISATCNERYLVQLTLYNSAKEYMRVDSTSFEDCSKYSILKNHYAYIGFIYILYYLHMGFCRNPYPMDFHIQKCTCIMKYNLYLLLKKSREIDVLIKRTDRLALTQIVKFITPE